MITDNKTNILYLADTLPKNYKRFYPEFEKVLIQNNINFKLLPNTKDIWAVDYMPIQIEENKFVQFVYNPSYLQSIKWLKSISDTDTICKEIGIETIKSRILIDGGNVVRTTDKVIMTDKVFSENPTYERKQLLKELHELFQVDKIFLVPQQPHDYTGHSDGMVRFIDEQTVIINDYSCEKDEFSNAFEDAIYNTGLEYIKIPYNPSPKYKEAIGDYINYLQMDGIIIIPTYGLKEDETVVRQFEQLFKGQKIVTVDGTDIAKDGGVLNCITWNIHN